jgi:hypothetical protein
MRSRLSLSVLVFLSTQLAWAQVQEFRVNTYTLGNQTSPGSAMDSEGNFVVVWTSSAQDGSEGGIFGQRFDASGSPLGSEFQVNGYTTGNQGGASVAMDPSGRFVVVWSGGGDSESSGIFAQRFDVDGTPLGSEFQVNEYTTGRQYIADVALDDQGNFVVVWQTGTFLDDPRIRGRRFDVSGSPLGSEFGPSNSTLDGSIRPAVAMNGDGEFVVTWSDADTYEGLPMNVWNRPYDSSGAPLCGPRAVNLGRPVRGNDVAMIPSGEFLVTWSEFESGTGHLYDVSVRRFHGCASAGSEMRVNTFRVGSQSWPTVAADAAGNFIVAWDSHQDGSGLGIFAQRFDGDDNPVGTEYQVNTYTPENQSLPAAAMNGSGSLVLAWSSAGQDGSSLGVYAQRGDLATPPPPAPSSRAALSVDRHPSGGASNLNGLLEAFETVRVEPVWRNGLASEVELTGTASNLIGPPGAGYEITDASADYGSIPAGETRGCAEATGDCYEVAIVGPRLAPHWDAVLEETPSTGALATWTLHIAESFLDVPTTHMFYADVETIFHHGVTAGCGNGSYCPEAPVRRDEMAVFLLKARHGSSYVPPFCTGVFLDVSCPGPFADWIEQLFAEDITAGCGGSTYCPSNPVTRAQMAAFLLKAKHGSGYTPPACNGIFSDVPCPSLFAAWIEQLFNESVTAGCGGENYCPDSSNTRGQMAVFLVKAFGLKLYGP